MDTTHIHLLLNHVPILGSFFGFLLLVVGLIMKNRVLERAALVTLIVTCLVGIPAFLSGEGAEERVEHLGDVSESYIEQHEEMATIAFWMMNITGVTALLTFALSLVKGSRNPRLTLITMLLAIVTFGTMVATGNYGGQIRHSELREGAPVQEIQSTPDHDEAMDD